KTYYLDVWRNQLFDFLYFIFIIGSKNKFHKKCHLYLSNQGDLISFNYFLNIYGWFYGQLFLESIRKTSDIGISCHFRKGIKRVFLKFIRLYSQDFFSYIIDA